MIATYCSPATSKVDAAASAPAHRILHLLLPHFAIGLRIHRRERPRPPRSRWMERRRLHAAPRTFRAKLEDRIEDGAGHVGELRLRAVRHRRPGVAARRTRP